jgi:ribosomal protein L37AE/L43A
MEYQFEKQICTNCKKPEFCIRKDLDWLCQDCFSWSVGFAEQKDMINQIMLDSKIEDLELRNDRD